MNKTSKILIFSLIVLSTVASHAMHNQQSDNKATNEHYLHYDDKSEADRVATLKAKAQANKEIPDEDGLLGALGNPKSKPLAHAIAEDAATHKENQKAAQVEKTIAENGPLGMALFDRLPSELKTKIVTEYYDRAIPKYVLHHKRELVPILFIDKIPYDASDVLNLVDSDVNLAKKFVLPVIWRTKRKIAHGWRSINGYDDRTYDIDFNEEQLKNLMDSYSFEQLTFFVSLARIPASRTIAGTSLSSKDCATFASLDAPMQAKLKQLYWWIDFYTPNDCVLSIDDRIEWAQNKLMAHGAYWLQWATVRLPYLFKNANK
jgi:hypothetical protein